MTIWQTARRDPDAATPGWLAAALDRRPPVIGDATGVHIHDTLPLPRALSGGNHVIPSLDRLEQFQRRIGVPTAQAADRQRAVLDRLAEQYSAEPGSLLDYIGRTNLITHASSARLEALQKDGPSASGYPEFYGLARRLRLIAQLIKAGLTTTIYYTHLDGFDTHANQIERHQSLLAELGQSVKAFLDDLTKSGEAERVVVLVFSEFGRRLEENDSGGTDHGTAAPVFLLGKPVRAGLYGPHPDLSVLDDGDPKFAIDFRQVYATLLDRWLGVPSETVLGRAYDGLPILAG
jgi:uncharacterized protein (DUF1501 family)